MHTSNAVCEANNFVKRNNLQISRSTLDIGLKMLVLVLELVETPRGDFKGRSFSWRNGFPFWLIFLDMLNFLGIQMFRKLFENEN